MSSIVGREWLRGFAAAWLLATAATACSPANPQADVVSADGTMDGASVLCTSHVQCDDQLFCNGAERCMPGAPGANALGCVAGTPPCGAGSSCNETLAQCVGAPADGGDAGNCDEDGDGVQGPQCGGLDCDDRDPYRAPNQRERCDGMLPNGMPAAGHDEDCDPCTVSGSAPDGDSDGDGYARSECINPWRSAAAPTGCDVRLAVVPASSTVRGQDCNDDPAMRGAQQNPGLPEVCGNSVDDDCDGQADFGLLYVDLDHDNSGDRNATPERRQCALGWSGTHDDCDDTRQETYPGARELCDGRDNQCALPGAMAGGPLASEDMDGDHHSALGARCAGRGETGVPPFAFPKDDCDDSSPTRYAGAPEICGNGIDEDCDGVVDNPTQTVCDDRDGDGHGTMATMRTVMSCTLPAGTVTVCDDCDDTVGTGAQRFPGNREVCDGVDNDCDPRTGLGPNEDMDGDHFSSPTATCEGRGEGTAPPTAFPRTDCDDTNAGIHPGAVESCDRIDSDCSSSGAVATDEDQDNDGWASYTAACLARSETGAASAAVPRGDCDDTRASVHPVPPMEDLLVCDGLDNDCNGSTSELARSCADNGSCSAGGRCARPLGIAGFALGAASTCVRLNEGSVRCWGRNANGELGDGTTTNRSSPTVVLGLTSVVELAGGPQHTCARLNDGTVQCWGYNLYGRLGDGTTTSRSSPTVVPGLTNVAELAAGGAHTCARLSDGTVRCWGSNLSAQLGDGTMTDRSSPTVVPGLTNVAELAAGGGHTCARLNDGTVRCWGGNSSGALGDGTMTSRSSPTAVPGLTNVVELAAGTSHTCARLNDGTVRCWGYNFFGQLGDTTTTTRNSPTAVPGLANVVELAVGGGGQYSCARLADGTARCWGYNLYGQLGDGTIASRGNHAAVPGLTNVVEVAAGTSHTCARLTDGTARCWGYNTNNQLGDGTTTQRNSPTAVLGFATAVEVAAGGAHICARLDDGTVRCWGFNSSGQLGDGTMTQRTNPTAVLGLAGVAEVRVGSGHTCARLNDGTVRCWGANGLGQLGDGTTTDRNSPTTVPGLANVVELAAGGGHTCARLNDGTLRCWGGNAQGALGDGTTTQRNSPTTVLGLMGVVAVTAGNQHTCARLADNTVRCWGFNSNGQLGDGTTAQWNRPIVVPGLSNVGGVSAGASHTCARLADGTARCWGYNLYGQLGDGTTMPRSSPVAVLGLTSVVEVAAGGNHTCARLADGTVRCWGYNSTGQLGDTTLTQRTSPAVLPGLSSVVAVTAGLAHTCARLADSTVRCWGSNSTGQLGDGTTTQRSSPVVLPSL